MQGSPRSKSKVFVLSWMFDSGAQSSMLALRVKERIVGKGEREVRSTKPLNVGRTSSESESEMPFLF